jgi:general secretion pathway protein H
LSKRNLSSDEGNTLIEMLVVLGLIALLLSLALPAGTQRRSRGLDSEAMKIVAMLKAARMGAISKNVETVFEADLLQRSLSATGAGQRLQLSGDTALSMLTASQEVQSGRGAIRFFPDGSSSGGSVKLVQGRRSTAINIHWLTGRISRENGKAD